LLRVGLVGCGRVAEYHLRFISKRKDAIVAGIADVALDAARNLGNKYRVNDVFGSMEELLATAHLDVVHITTPPEWHFEQAREALSHGVHVVLEKPVALSQGQAAELRRTAEAAGVTFCADFIQLFHPRMQEAIRLVNEGALGRVIRCESHLGLDLNIPEVRESFGLHWSCRLPGGILHNYLSHPLYLVLYWVGLPVRTTTYSQSYGSLSQDLTDHVEVLLQGQEVFGRVVVSAVCKPFEYSVRVVCEHGSVFVDFNTSTVLVETESWLPRAVVRGFSNFGRAYHLTKQATANIFAVLARKIVPYQGLHVLIDQYYMAIQSRTAPPVPMDLSVAVTETEQEILTNAGKVHLDTHDRPSRQEGIRRSERVLVTGGTGYLGTELVRHLVAQGYPVRVYARPTSNIASLEAQGVEILFGDIRDHERLLEAAKDIDVIVHAAAGLTGSSDFIVSSCVGGTENVAVAASSYHVSRVVYISSQSVYDFSLLEDGCAITEDSPLEAEPGQRGAASLAKTQAEHVALAQVKAGGGWTILRPSVIFGGGRDLSSVLGVKKGNLLVALGSRSRLMRLVHIHDVCRAVSEIIQLPVTANKVYNLSHPDTVSFKDCVRVYKSDPKNRRVRVLFVAAWVAGVASLGLNVLWRVLGRRPPMNKKRFRYLFGNLRSDSQAFCADTGLTYPVPLLDQMNSDVQL